MQRKGDRVLAPDQTGMGAVPCQRAKAAPAAPPRSRPPSARSLRDVTLKLRIQHPEHTMVGYIVQRPAAVDPRARQTTAAGLVR